MTISAFMETHFSMTYSAFSEIGFLHMNSNSFLSAIMPYLIISAHPSENVEALSVFNILQSHITRFGCQNAPARFLPELRFTAVLPPTDESTMASRVVGTCIKQIPLKNTDAAKPAVSPTTPPPRATIASLRVISFSPRKLSILVSVCMDFDFSPLGNTYFITVKPEFCRILTKLSP